MDGVNDLDTKLYSHLLPLGECRLCRQRETGLPKSPNGVDFLGKGGARKRADVFLQRKTEQSGLCSEVAPPTGIEPITNP